MATILVIDDDRTQRFAAKLSLERVGHDIFEAHDGEEGLAMAKALAPDLIVCDVLMPNLNGFRVVLALRKDPALAKVPVLMVSTMADRVHVRAGMNSGADDYLTKPYKFSELVEAVEALLARRAGAPKPA